MTRTVSTPTGYGPNLQMSILGYIVAIGVAIVLLPLLPFIALLWLYFKLTDSSDEA